MPVITPRLRLRRAVKGLSGFAPRKAVRDRLSDLTGLRENPGELRARCYVPKGLAEGAPLVVVLHGCTQDAAVYDHGSGWSQLADRHGFALLYPEQRRANNPMLCFNWFEPRHTSRGRGEAASIAWMIEAMERVHGIDPARIFVTGLSAGGAMASVMLAAYPELFAGGAIIAGVAYGCADGVSEAFECMAGRGGRPDPQALARAVRGASRHEGPWPRVQVWQGSADTTVVPGNGEAIAAQWAAVHGLARAPDRADEVAGHPRRTWLGAGGEALVEHYDLAGMGHGVPLAGGRSGGGEAVGQPGPHMLDVGLSSTAEIARFFGIAEAQPRRRAEPAEEAALLGPAAELAAQVTPRPAARKAPRRKARPAADGVQAVIEAALRKAGLMR
jgi:poly(hydroxyalkanoate) depolymerase family esterase